VTSGVAPKGLKAGMPGLASIWVLPFSLLWFMPQAAPETLPLDVIVVEASPHAGQYRIVARLTQASGQALARFTQENLGRTIVINIDGRVLMKITVSEPIREGMFQLGGLPKLAAEALASSLSSHESKMAFESIPE